jgi:hypothetical protein
MNNLLRRVTDVLENALGRLCYGSNADATECRKTVAQKIVHRGAGRLGFFCNRFGFCVLPVMKCSGGGFRFPKLPYAMA